MCLCIMRASLFSCQGYQGALWERKQQTYKGRSAPRPTIWRNSSHNKTPLKRGTFIHTHTFPPAHNYRAIPQSVFSLGNNQTSGCYFVLTWRKKRTVWMLRYPSIDTQDRLILMSFHRRLTAAWQIGMCVCIFSFILLSCQTPNNCAQSLYCLTRNPISQCNSVWMRSCRQQTSWWDVRDPGCRMYTWVLAAL